MMSVLKSSFDHFKMLNLNAKNSWAKTKQANILYNHNNQNTSPLLTTGRQAEHCFWRGLKVFSTKFFCDFEDWKKSSNSDLHIIGVMVHTSTLMSKISHLAQGKLSDFFNRVSGQVIILPGETLLKVTSSGLEMAYCCPRIAIFCGGENMWTFVSSWLLLGEWLFSQKGIQVGKQSKR